MNTRAVMAATGVLLLASAGIVALNGMWAVGGMDDFSREWSRRSRPAPPDAGATGPTESEVFDSLNRHVGHRLSRLIVWSLAAQGLTGIMLLVTSYRMRTTPVLPDTEPGP